MKLAIVIPVHNEGRRLQAFLVELIAWLRTHRWSEVASHESCSIVVVDDGSLEPVSLELGEMGDANRVVLMRHHTNLGQGAALQTGIVYGSSTLGCDTFVTMDADGQHQPGDLPALLEALYRERVDIVFGNRFASGAQIQVPPVRRLILRAAIAFEGLITGLRLHDAHNGYRAFTAKTAALMKLKQARMAHATEFKQITARERLKYAEVPVSIRYAPETLAKGQRNIGSLAIIKDLLKVYLFND